MLQTVHMTGGIYEATFAFTLTAGELATLRCAGEYLELDFHLEGFYLPTEWDDYWISGTDLPNATHDVAYGDAPGEHTPGVTGIPTSLLVSGRQYFVTLGWDELDPYGLAHVWMGWIPSHWASPVDPYEQVACQVAGNGTHAGWCVFPNADEAVYLKTTIGLPNGRPTFHGVQTYQFSPQGFSSSIQPEQGSAGGSPPPPPPSRLLFVRGDSAVFAKDSLGDGGWVQESEPGSINKIAVGGRYQMVLNACNAVYARDTLGMHGWIQQTPCGGASQIAISNTGVQMVIDGCSAVWAKAGISASTPFVQEVGCGNASKIAVGGNTQMFIRGDAAIFAKDWVGSGGWVQEVGPGNANAIAVDNTGLQAFIRGDAAVFAKRGIGDGGWQMQVGPGNAAAISAGGGVLAFIRGDSAVFAKTNISIDGGWTQETAPGTANLIDVGDNGRQMIRTGDNAVWAKDGIGYGGWVQQVGPGNANAIAVG